MFYIVSLLGLHNRLQHHAIEYNDNLDTTNAYDNLYKVTYVALLIRSSCIACFLFRFLVAKMEATDSLMLRVVSSGFFVS